MRRRSPLLLALAALLANAAALVAADKPAVELRFVVAEETYTDEFDEVDLDWIHRGAAEFLVEKLDREAGFLDYSGDELAGHLLTFQLGRAEAEGSLREVAFHVAIGERSGQGGPETLDEITLPFRNKFAFGAEVGERETFLDEITAKLSLHDFRLLVPDLLSRVPVGAGGDLVKQPVIVDTVAWIIPFRHTELCMDMGSRLRVAAELATQAGPRPRDFDTEATQAFDPPGPSELEHLRHRLICVPFQDQQDFALLTASEPDDVTVKRIYVLDYQRMPGGCAEAESPEEAFGEDSS